MSVPDKLRCRKRSPSGVRCEKHDKHPSGCVGFSDEPGATEYGRVYFGDDNARCGYCGRKSGGTCDPRGSCDASVRASEGGRG